MTNILSVKNLTVKFEDKTVIENIYFDLNKGDSLVIIGPNGAGKTVLLRALLKTIPYLGQISWAPGVKIGYVPQKIEIDRNLPLNLKNLFLAKARFLHLVFHPLVLLEEVGLPKNFLNIPLGHLSGGQLQRAFIAFALLGNPNVLLFDEPTTSIDQPGQYLIYKLIHELQERRNITTITVSHDLNFVHQYATSVLCLNKKAFCYGPPTAIFDSSILEKIYGPHKYFRHSSHQHKHQDEHQPYASQ